MEDTGRVVALAVGQQLIVTVQMRRISDNTWYVAQNSGVPLKLIAGPKEIRGRGRKPWEYSQQVFYFQRESPGTAHLVLEQNYFSKPLILEVVDR